MNLKMDGLRGNNRLNASRENLAHRKDDLVNFLEDAKCLAIINNVWETLRKDPLFQVSEREITNEMPLNEIRRLSHKRMAKFKEYNFITDDTVAENPMITAYIAMLAMFYPGFAVREQLNESVCTNRCLL